MVVNHRLVLLLCGLALALAAHSALAQPTFSVDFQGPTVWIPVAPPIFQGDILIPFPGRPAVGPLPRPRVLIPGGPPGTGLGILTYPQLCEVDALSYGQDFHGCNSPCGYWHFSVDEFAIGQNVGVPPNVFSEGALGNQEASADIFSGVGAFVHPTLPFPPPGLVLPNLRVIDGDGLDPAGFPILGLGLIEPNPPIPGLPDQGDNLDALDMDWQLSPVEPVVFFSLDSRFVDPIEGPPANTGTAVANGFLGGDVLMSRWGGPPTLYAPAWRLGLVGGGQDLCDVDALVLQEDGDLEYTPGRDFLAFSVRRGSGVIGRLDSRWGIPIAPGDILVPPVPGGLNNNPGILVPAEALGLLSGRTPPGELQDDLDALDLAWLLGDADGDGLVSIFDVIDTIIAFGSVPGDPNWDPRCDYDCSLAVDIFDVIDVITSFGNTW